MRRPISVDPPGDFISPDLPIVEGGPFRPSIRSVDHMPEYPMMIAMIRPASAAIRARLKPYEGRSVISGPCTSRDIDDSFLLPVHPIDLC